MSTGYIYEDKYLDHILEYGHPESPERLKAINKRMKETGLAQEVTTISVLSESPFPFIKKIHSDWHSACIQKIPVTGEVAHCAVAGALGAVKAVGQGVVSNAFCALRPPGHHAHNSGFEEGFCFYNNVAIAARYTQQVLGYKRILIIDWDYHHGNGTQDAFSDDPSVLFFSTHNWFAYPGTGSPQYHGTGDGFGYTINVHLEPGATDHDILSAWDTQLVPKVEHFKPDFVLISAGFDSRKDDRIGNFCITDNCFARLTRIALDIAKTHCNGRLVSLLEGGYTVEGLANAVSAHVKALVEYT